MVTEPPIWGKIKKRVTTTNTDTGNINNYEVIEQFLPDEKPVKNYGGPNLGYKIIFFETSLRTILDLELSASEFRILFYLILKMQKDTAYINFSPTVVALEFNLSREQVSRIKSKFLKSNIIVKHDGLEYISAYVAWKGKDQFTCFNRRKDDPRLVKPVSVKKHKQKKTADIINLDQKRRELKKIKKSKLEGN